HLQFSESRFPELKRQQRRHWRNSSKNKPVARLFGQWSVLLYRRDPEIDLLAEALDILSFSQFHTFHPQILRGIHAESLLLGNWTGEQAAQLTRQLQQWQSQLHSCGARLANTTFNMQGMGPVWLQLDVEHSDHALVIYLPAQQASAEQMAHFMLANHV